MYDGRPADTGVGEGAVAWHLAALDDGTKHRAFLIGLRFAEGDTKSAGDLVEIGDRARGMDSALADAPCSRFSPARLLRLFASRDGRGRVPPLGSPAPAALAYRQVRATSCGPELLYAPRVAFEQAWMRHISSIRGMIARPYRFTVYVFRRVGVMS